MQMEQLHLRPVVISEHVNLKRTEPQWQLALYVFGVFMGVSLRGTCVKGNCP
jgi:hypothetical protein